MTTREMASLFYTAWIQVFLISINTLFLARGLWAGVAVASWLISYTWVSNVRKVKDPGKLSRIVYATGACAGAMTGILFVNLLTYIV
jgi:hypothetical protein